ncbi:MAG TPA: DUF481 domain-containing protein [Longimicrobiales bacterium]|nr:DUF481 domain-containing protein [Longimicrobiales bacterium]
MPRLSLALTLFTLLAPGLSAQDEKPWKLEGEMGASLFFGASQQSAVLFRGGYSLESDRLELGLSAGFDYGEAEDEAGVSFVNKRSWVLGTELDYEIRKWSPFVFVTGEGSLKRQIDLRVSGGAGARYTFIRNDDTRLDVSVAVLAERTDARAEEGEPDETDTLARWSNRLRFSRKFGGDRAEFGLISMYQPAFEDVADDYTVDVETFLAFALNGSVSFKVSLVDKYDALATTRGATSNNDGRLFFSVLVTK